MGDILPDGPVPAAPDIHAWCALAADQRRRGDHEACLASHEAAARIEPGNPWLRLETGFDLLALGRATEARARFAAVVADAPGLVAAHTGLARCAREDNDRAGALAAFQQAARIDPDNAWVQAEIGADLLELGRPEDAERVYAALVQSHPGEAYGHQGLGLCARRRGDRAAALRCFQAAAAAMPDSAWLHAELAADLLALGRTAEARATCAALLAREPESLAGLLAMAAVARATGDRAGALHALRGALASAPDCVAAHAALAVELLEAGQPDAARASARAALHRVPGSLHALLVQGMIERQERCHEAALACFAEAHRLHPRAAQPLLEMAFEQRTLGRQAEADRLLDAAQSAEPGGTIALVRRAEQALMAQRPEQALAWYDQALAREPASVPAIIGRAEALAAAGDLAAALALLAAEDRGPATPAALTLALAGLLRRAGHWDEALGLARRMTERTPWSFAAWMERVQGELLRGDMEAVEASLLRAPAHTAQEQAQRARLAGLRYEAEGQCAAADACLGRAVALDPGSGEIRHDLVRSALRRLDLAAARGHLRAFCGIVAPYQRLQGRSPNLSQTHFGQIMDEYRLDPAVPTALPALLARPPAARLAGLQRLVAERPESTASAVALVQTLDALGVVGRARPPGAAPAALAAVPRTIMQFWSSHLVPRDVVALMATWPEHNPGFRLERFRDETAAAFLDAQYGAAMRDAFLRLRQPAQRADLFRLGWLFACGGVYADADDRCLAPLHDLLPPPAGLVLYQEDFGTIGNNFMAAAPRHPVLETALEMALQAAARGDNDVVWLATGPALLTRALAVHAARRGDGWRGLFERIVVLRRRDLFRAVAIHCLAGYKATDRHWGNAAFRRAAAAPT